MRCLCCGGMLSEDECRSGWHFKCIKRFFGTRKIPEIDISEDAVKKLAEETVNRKFTVPGVQKKLSLHLFSEDKPRLTLVDYPTGYILKPQVEEFTALPEAEQLCMMMAEVCGIRTVPHGLINVNGQYAYITRRVDRIFKGNSITDMLAMEDFCQLDLRLTQDKYKGSYERCAGVTERYSSRPMLDITELFIRLVFFYISGNSDMHLKNFSLIETAPGNGEYVMAPAYDLVPVNLVMPEDKDQTALTLNGKKRNIRKKDFFVFSEHCGISRKAAEKMIYRIVSCMNKFENLVSESYITDEMKEKYIEMIRSRAEVLS